MNYHRRPAGAMETRERRMMEILKFQVARVCRQMGNGSGGVILGQVAVQLWDKLDTAFCATYCGILRLSGLVLLFF